LNQKKSREEIMPAKGKILILAMLALLAACLWAEDGYDNDKEISMTKEEILQLHQDMGIAYFNQSWELLLKPDRTKAEDDELINMVHASLFHWRQLEQPINILRGEWMIAHVYTVLEHKEAALYHAKNALEWVENAKAEDWDLAYAYEAMSRAQALNGNKEEFQKYHDLAEAAGNLIKNDEDRKQFEADLNDTNWFGMK
jgi:hypothetical protein